MADSSRVSISTKEWVALEKWYKETTGQELPQRIIGGYIRTDDPIYVDWTKARKPGFSPARGSPDWWSQKSSNLSMLNTNKPSGASFVNGFPTLTSTQTGQTNIDAAEVTTGVPGWVWKVPGYFLFNSAKNK